MAGGAINVRRLLSPWPGSPRLYRGGMTWAGPFLAAWLLLSTSTPFAQPGGPPPCRSQDPPLPIPDIALERVASGFRHPTHLTHAGDGSGRLFVVEQAGVVWTLKDGKRLPHPFLDLRDRVASGGEKGLLSVAFHPEFPRNRRFSVNYTAGGFWKLETIVSEFIVGADPNRADTASERVLLRIDQPYANHNGGQLAFGPDGYLYIGMGDGGSANDPHGHGQNLGTLLGAALRVDVNQREGSLPYAIPPDNPFIGKPGARPEIWAYGLRNPWRFSFDAGTGRLYAGDVGQHHREEIDLIERGKNYGWNIMEGTICTPGVNPDCDSAGLEPPIWEYTQAEGISVIGGFVYRGKAIPALCGAYLFGDWGSGRLWALRHDGRRVTHHRLLLTTSLAISSFGVDEQHELYVVDHRGGQVYRIRGVT